VTRIKELKKQRRSAHQTQWAARGLLKSAWDSDQKSPRQYPMDTSWALAQVEQSVAKYKPDKPTRISLRKLLNPRTLAELVPEAQISAVCEEYNSGTFKNAIKLAAKINYENTKKSWKLFKTITRAIEATYLASFLGHEFLSKPKVNILHTGLYRIAQATELADQNKEGFAQFLDDICPCGLKNHKGAVRKLLERSERIGRAAV
jgi:hypothetical protein